MPELVIPAETPATESAPVTNLSELTPEQRQEWRKTGEFPKPKAADSAPATEVPEVPEVADSEPATAAPDSAPAKQQEPHRKTKEDTERRFREILDENKTLKQRLDEVERRTASKQESQPAAAAKVDAKPEPKIEDRDDKGEFKYKTLDEYNKAVRDYDREQLGVQIKKELAESQKAEAKRQQQQTLSEDWNRKVEEARKEISDFDAVALNKQLPIEIKEGSVVDMFVLDSPHGARVLYAITKDNCSELARISKLNPLAQARELTKIELTFAEPKKEPAPPKTSAPKPPSEVGGRGTQPTDSALAAVQANDYRAAKATWNRQALGK